jgi:predicted permease
MNFLTSVAADLLFTLRMFRKNLSFSLVAMLSLALGIGASSAIFSLVYALLVDPYPYKNSERIINISFSDKRGDHGTLWYSIPDFLEIQKSSKTLEDVAAREETVLVVTSGLPESVRGVAFSPNAFEHFGVPAMLGRTFVPADIPQVAAPPRIAVLSYLFWQKHFNANTGVIGQTLELNHQPYTVMGVVPPRFTWNDADVYVPMPLTSDARHFVPLMARVKPGLTLDAVSAELQAMSERFAKQNPDLYPKGGFRIHAQRLNDFLLQRFGGTLNVLAAAVGFLLLIACANVSILLLARASARQKEIAVRISLGAGARRVVQQLLTESIVLSLLGGLLGVLLAYRGVGAIVALMPQYSVPHEAEIQVNGQVVLFTFAISVLTGILFGMAPALQLAKTDVNRTMQESGRGTTANSRGGRTHSLLIVAEIALTMILLVGAGVAIRGFIAMSRTPLGYQPENVLTVNLNLIAGHYGTWEKRGIFFRNVVESLRTIPGVKAATLTETAVPPRIGFNTDFEIAGQPKAAKQKTRVGLIASDYFSTLGIPLLQGRLQSEAEIQRAGRFAVINEEMARRYWPSGRDPIGVRIQVPELKLNVPDIFIPPTGDQWFEIIGVVGTARNQGLQDKPDPAIYIPYTMALVPGSVFLLKTEGDPHSIVRAVRERVRAIDADQPVTEVRTLDEVLADYERAYPRFSATLFSVFAFVGLLLAATGLYSIISYTVSRRTHEFGIRMALGAQRTDVLRLVLGLTAALTAAGVAIGLAGSLALNRIIARYVAAWDPNDPIAYIAVSLVLGTVALLACWLPARRAIEIQPMLALRHE